MMTVIDRPRRGYRTIRLALAEADYAWLMSDGELARAQLDQMHSQQWAERALPDSPMKCPTLDRCAQRAQFSRSDDPTRAHRTSHLVDQWMKFLDRACF
jgi:hypothetical protein